MDMVVKGDLIPLFGHFKQMVVVKQMSDSPGFAKCGNSEIVGQLKLMFRFSLCPNQVFHNLQQYPGRIFGHGTANGVHKIVLKACQGFKASCDITAFNGFHEVDNGICSAKASGFCKFFYP